jgi:hypothetical protein
MDRRLRARVLMAEATDLGVTIDDLIAAATALEVRSAPVTVAEFVATIAPTFSPNSAPRTAGRRATGGPPGRTVWPRCGPCSPAPNRPG